MKNDRQTILLEIIEQEAVETQEQLLRLLAERGVKCTQATVSRDIKQLHLVKEPTGQGRYRYAVSVQKSKLNFAEKLRTIFRECVLSVEAAQNLVVLKTIEGMAQGAAFTLDNMGDTDIVGTLAGDDTILLVFHDNVQSMYTGRTQSEYRHHRGGGHPVRGRLQRADRRDRRGQIHCHRCPQRGAGPADKPRTHPHRRGQGVCQRGVLRCGLRHRGGAGRNTGGGRLPAAAAGDPQ